MCHLLFLVFFFVERRESVLFLALARIVYNQDQTQEIAIICQFAARIPRAKLQQLPPFSLVSQKTYFVGKILSLILRTAIQIISSYNSTHTQRRIRNVNIFWQLQLKMFAHISSRIHHHQYVVDVVDCSLVVVFQIHVRGEQENGILNVIQPKYGRTD